MPVADITNPDTIKFLVESYDRTTRLRMKWNQIHAEKLQKAVAFKGTEKGYSEISIMRENIAGGLPAITRDHVNAGMNRRSKPIRDAVHFPGTADLKKGHSLPEVGLGDTEEDPRLAKPDSDLTIEPIMRPIDPKQKKIVYKDIPFFGREVYLKSRHKISPEKKYYFNECSGWDYGWRLRDSYFNNNAPRFGRVWRLARDVKSRTGPQPDPNYYRSSDIPGPSKCS